jgi:hypothetical protein
MHKLILLDDAAFAPPHNRSNRASDLSPLSASRNAPHEGCDMPLGARHAALPVHLAPTLPTLSDAKQINSLFHV